MGRTTVGMRMGEPTAISLADQINDFTNLFRAHDRYCSTSDMVWLQ